MRNERDARKGQALGPLVSRHRGLLWNSIGAVDFAAMMVNFEPYLKSVGNMSNADIAFYQALPFWHKALWMIGTWGGLIGSILLLIKSWFAVPVFAASLIGAGVSIGRLLMMDNVARAAASTGFSVFIWIVAAALLAYAMWMRPKGVLH